MTYNFETMSLEAALEVLVGLEVLRWGEAERAPALQKYQHLSRGRAINSIAHHVVLDYGDKLSPEEQKAAKQQLSPKDRKSLRTEGS